MSFEDDSEYWEEGEPYEQYENEDTEPTEEEPVEYYDPDEKINAMEVAIKMYIQEYREKMAVPIGNRITAEKVDNYVRTVMKH